MLLSAAGSGPRRQGYLPMWRWPSDSKCARRAGVDRGGDGAALSWLSGKANHGRLRNA